LGKPLKNICQALIRILEDNPDTSVIFPMHKNPRIREAVNNILKNKKRMILLDTLDYKDMINLISKSSIILTDSGGVQEEAPSLGNQFWYCVMKPKTGSIGSRCSKVSGYKW